MNDPLIARFALACGADTPLDLRVDLADGGVLAEGSVNQPFTLVGRDDSCDVTLSDPDVNPRHAWLQVLGGRVFAVDLGSRTGVIWPDAARRSGWLDVGTSARIGPFRLHLKSPVTERPSRFSPDYNPLAADTTAKAHSSVALEFRNGQRVKDRWQVNRLITLVGRAPECKIHLTSEDISSYHCGLVSTKTGLWVVDLSGRGVVVNGERMRVAPLPHGAELWIGRFLIGCQYQMPTATRGSMPRPAPVSQSASTLERVVPFPPGAGSTAKMPRPQPTPSSVLNPPTRSLPEDDEIELGAPVPAGTSNSNIMSYVFRSWGGNNASGPVSSPLMVSSTGPNSVRYAEPMMVPVDSSVADLYDSSDITSAAKAIVRPILQEMAEIHKEMDTAFESWLTSMNDLFNRVKRDNLAFVQRELNRIEDLTAEIAELQSEVSRQTLTQAASEREKRSSASLIPGKGPVPNSGAPWVSPSRPTPMPDPPPSGSPHDRLNSLKEERATRWQSVIALMAEEG